jgi:hypothetical protein
MAIDVRLRNERGIDVDGCNEPYVPVVAWDERAAFPMLGHIDPYGDTVFNVFQMREMLAELDRVCSRLADDGIDRPPVLEEIRRLCDVGQRHPHQYLWFIGD